MRLSSINLQGRCNQAFTLVEVLMAVAVIATVVTALYLSISAGFRVVETARENLRATQIMVERLETLRLYNWDQLNDSTMFQTKFTNHYNHVDNSGFEYVGEITVAPFSDSEDYGSKMREIGIAVTWTSGGVTRTRTMYSLVARDGIQNYVY